MGSVLADVMLAENPPGRTERRLAEFHALTDPVDIFQWLEDELPGFIDEVPGRSLEAFLAAVR
ncbi:MAG TPA: hypothetical protein VKA15_23145 [Isosphaeraceae bacterium]|nr:hypothetical protein [Isosphaeraceae bacterium]